MTYQNKKKGPTEVNGEGPSYLTGELKIIKTFI